MLHDLRYAVRRLVRSPGFATAAILTLALGIGANAAVFTVVNTVLLSDLPVPEPARVVKVYTSDFSSGPYGGSSYPDFADYRAQATTFVDLAAYTPFAPMSLGTGTDAERLQGAVVTGNFFDLLGIPPAAGRFFLPEEDATPGSHPVAVLSHDLWLRSFGGRPEVIGDEVTINGSRFTIVGVAPASFRGVELVSAPALWVPMSMLEQAMPRRAGSGVLTRRGNRWLQMVGRVADGRTLTEARAEVTTIAARLAEAYPSTNLGTLQDPDSPRPMSVLPASTLAIGPLDESLLTRVAQLLMAVVGFVLLITCANVANLLLARSSGRQREIAVRQSLGAGRGRLVRQLLTESSVIAALGGAVGLAVGVWATRLLSALVPEVVMEAGLSLPAFALDWRVVLVTAAIALVTGFLFGLAPALQTTRPDLVPALKDGTIDPRAQRARLRNGLVVAQIALSLVLLIGAGLFVRSLQTALATDPGFRSDGVLLANLDLSLQRYDTARGRNLYTELLERVGALPGVQAVSLAQVVPVNPAGSRRTVTVEGYAPRPQEDMELNLNAVERGYFDAMGIAFLQGRTFGPGAGAQGPGEVIVNESFANRYWPGQSAVGRGISFGADDLPDRVVGVVEDGKYRSMREDGLPYMYRPLGSNYSPTVTLVARTDGDPGALLPAVRGEVRAIDPGLPLFNLRTLDDQLASAMFGERTGALLLGVFGLIALFLAAIGIYGVVAQGVQQRTHEIGIRMALGASRRAVVQLVVGQGMGLAFVGLLLGLIGAFALTRATAALLFGVSPTDATTFAIGPAVLIAVAFLACLLPARRAARVDPMTALRYE